MPATQQVDKLTFGSGRVFYTPAGATQSSKYGNVMEFDLDVKVDLKEIWDENGFPLAAFDGHKSLDLSVKHYALRLDGLQNDFNQSAPVASTEAYSLDENVTVPAGTPFTVTLAQGAQFIAGSLDLVMYIGTNKNPVTYSIVNAGSEVAGSAASVSAAGVITFAAADAGLTGKATYRYTNTNGKQITIVNQYQNSAGSYKLYFVKRDLSVIDSSVGQLIVTLNAVRFGGIKLAYKEGGENVYERTLKAFADPTGTIGKIQIVNTTTNNAP